MSSVFLSVMVFL